MNKLLKYFIFFGVALFAVACTDLEEDLVGDITTDFELPAPPSFDVVDPANPDRISALTAAYGELRNAGTANHGGYYSIQEITTDEMCIAAKGGDWFDGGILIDLHKHTYGSAHPFVDGTWVQIYNAIGTINGNLADGNLSPEGVAQARGLRAYFYWRLLDLFGRVKVVTEPGVDAPQSSRQEVFAFVESELLDALGVSEVSAGMDLSGSLLPDGGSAYNLNRYGALGILAKLYLNAEVYAGTAMYEEAEICASYIIDNGGYKLCGSDCSVSNFSRRAPEAGDPETRDGYAAVFAPNNGGNPEHIFVVQYDEVAGTGMNFSQMNLHYSSQFTYNFNEQPWNGYASLEEFYNSYEESDLRKEASFLVGPQTDFGGSAILDFASDDDNIELSYSAKINELQPNSLREAGARPAKFSFKIGGLQHMDNDYPIVRLGQVYLIRGEARARKSGNWSDAEMDVNLLRNRAGVSPYSGNLTADEFLAERGREMFQEASRRTDLIRFGKYNGTWWEKPASDPTRNVFPIPQNQINASNGTLTQNPGY